MPGGSNFPPPGMLPVRHHQNDDMSYMFFLVRESLKKSFICDDCPPSSVFQINQRNASKWQKHPAGSLNSPRTWAGCRSATNVGDAQKLDINPHPNPPITESVGDYKSTLKGERYLTKKKRNIRHKSEVPWWYDVGIVFFWGFGVDFCSIVRIGEICVSLGDPSWGVPEPLGLQSQFFADGRSILMGMAERTIVYSFHPKDIWKFDLHILIYYNSARNFQWWFKPGMIKFGWKLPVFYRVTSYDLVHLLPIKRIETLFWPKWRGNASKKKQVNYSLWETVILTTNSET